MARKIVSGETAFQVDAHSFSVSPSNEGYTLQYSADGINFTSFDEPVPASETLIVNGVAFNQYIRLLGNASEVTIIY